MRTIVYVFPGGVRHVVDRWEVLESRVLVLSLPQPDDFTPGGAIVLNAHKWDSITVSYE